MYILIDSNGYFKAILHILDPGDLERIDIIRTDPNIAVNLLNIHRWTGKEWVDEKDIPISKNGAYGKPSRYSAKCIDIH